MSTGLTQTEQAPQVLMHMMVGFWISQAIYAAAKLNVADQLISGPKTISVLAEALKVDESNLYRLLRALASIGVFQGNQDNTFALTPISHLLCSAHPESMLPAILMLGDENYRSWAHLVDAIQLGQVPFERVYGLQAYEYYRKNPAMGERFNAAMAALNRQDILNIVEAYDFGTFNTIVDVGGGNGILLASILKRYPKLLGILFELPQVAEDANMFLKQAGMESRCRLETGDFFNSIASGGDAYLLVHIIHTFSDELCIQILQNVQKVMPEAGKLLIIEDILQPDSDPSTAKTKFMDLNMLVLTPGGREHTQEEFEQLLQKSGFKLTRIIPTASGKAIIEAVKILTGI